MIRIFATAVIALGFAAAPAAAQTIIPLETLTLGSGATRINGVINFTEFGGTATTTTLSSFLTIGQNYTIDITGSDGTGNRKFLATYPGQGSQTLNFGDDGLTLSFLVMT